MMKLLPSLRLFPISIRHKLIAMIMLTCVAVLILTMSGALFIDLSGYKQHAARRMAAQAEVLASNTSAALMFNDPKASAELLKSFEYDSNIARATVYSSDGSIFSSYTRQDFKEENLPKSVAASQPLNYFKDGLLHIVQPVMEGQDNLGAVYLQSDLPDFYMELSQHIQLVGFMFLAAVLTAFLISIRFQRSITEPVLNLVRAAKAVTSDNNYGVRAVKLSQDETGLLVEAFNNMLEQIQLRDSQIRKAHDELEVRVVERTRELTHEIEERKRVQDILQLQSSALEAAANSILITEKTGTIIWANTAFSRMTGFMFDEAKGKTPRILKSGAHDNTFYQRLWQTIQGGDVWRGEIINRKKDGTLYTQETIIAPVRSAQGRITHFIGIQQDITDRKRLEQMKDEFLSTVSHELRTPLAIIREAVSNLNDGICGELNKDQSQVATIATRNAERLARIINDMLDFSRLESGRERLNFTLLDLKALSEEILHSFSGTASERKISLDLDCPDDPPQTRADETLIARVFFNLVDNAIRYARSKVQVKIAAGPGTLQISISDDGQGIAEDDLKLLFTKFVQIQRPFGGEGYKGTGLGLAISKDIIEYHGGKIWVESTLGTGTAFHFTLPVDNGNP